MQCQCPCHQSTKVKALRVAPDVRDLTEAAVACRSCINRHVLVFTVDWPWPYIPRPANTPFTTTIAHDPPTPLPAADGIPYDPSDPANDTDHS